MEGIAAILDADVEKLGAVSYHIALRCKAPPTVRARRETLGFRWFM